MKLPILFFDDGGVLNDNRLRGPQWQRLVGEFFSPRLGGDPAAWAAANRDVIDDLVAQGGWEALMLASANQADYDRRYYALWLPGMCRRVGVPLPPEAEWESLALAAEAYIIPRVRSAIPGVVEAIRALHASGYTLHMGSGGSSRLLQMYLEQMGIRECFGRLYGPDLIDAFKTGPHYHAAILAAENLKPDEALFLDDSPKVLGWAQQVGARTLLVGDAAATNLDRIGSVAELPAWLRSKAHDHAR